MTDQEIFNGIVTKDNSTFSYLYTEYKNMIFSMVKKNSGDDTDAHDVFQDGLVALWVNIASGKYQLSENVKLSSYLYTLCRNIWISKIRKRKPTQELLEKDEQALATEVDVDTDKFEKVNALMLNLKKLGEACQKLLKLFYYEKTSLKLIAQKMSITEKTAKNNKYRCMQNLRSLYK